MGQHLNEDGSVLGYLSRLVKGRRAALGQQFDLIVTAQFHRQTLVLFWMRLRGGTPITRGLIFPTTVAGFPANAVRDRVDATSALNCITAPEREALIPVTRFEFPLQGLWLWGNPRFAYPARRPIDRPRWWR
jgi:hypothetical protein